MSTLGEVRTTFAYELVGELAEASGGSEPVEIEATWQDSSRSCYVLLSYPLCNAFVAFGESDIPGVPLIQATATIAEVQGLRGVAFDLFDDDTVLPAALDSVLINGHPLMQHLNRDECIRGGALEFYLRGQPGWERLQGLWGRIRVFSMRNEEFEILWRPRRE